MILLVIWLFVETQRAVDREMKHRGIVQHTLRRERCTYTIITLLFGLSYVIRFYLDKYNSCRDITGSYFGYDMTLTVCFLLEALSMGVLMGFHFVNFKYGNLLASIEELKYVSVRMGELHRFDTDEVE